jgi:hypothetical protein
MYRRTQTPHQAFFGIRALHQPGWPDHRISPVWRTTYLSLCHVLRNVPRNHFMKPQAMLEGRMLSRNKITPSVGARSIVSCLRYI